MPAKTPVDWGLRSLKKPPALAPDALENFVHPAKTQDVRRLNLNIPTGLHARIKAQCALEGRDMTTTLIELLEARFDASMKDILK